MEIFWVLEYDSLKQQIEGKSRFPPDLYKADRETIEAYFEIQKIYEPRYQLREATVDDWAAVERAGYEIKYIDLDPDCRDWYFQVGVGRHIKYLPADYDMTPETSTYRNTPLSEMLATARQRQESDPLSHVSFRPATQKEITEDEAEAEAAEYQREEAKWNLKLVAMLLLGVNPDNNRALARLQYTVVVGVMVVGWLCTLALAYLGLRLFLPHPVIGVLLLLPIGSLIIGLAWRILKWLLYQVSFAVGKGFQDGKKQRKNSS